MFKTISDISPFSLLPVNEQENVLSAFSVITLKRGTVLLEQEISQLDKFYLFFKGLGQYYFQEFNTKILKGTLEPGDNFGGLSLIFNEGMAIRSLKIMEDSELLSLDASNVEFQIFTFLQKLFLSFTWIKFWFGFFVSSPDSNYTIKFGLIYFKFL